MPTERSQHDEDVDRGWRSCALDAPCAQIGAHLRHEYDALSAAPLPDRLADLAAALEAVCAGRARRTARRA